MAGTRRSDGRARRRGGVVAAAGLLASAVLANLVVVSPAGAAPIDAAAGTGGDEERVAVGASAAPTDADGWVVRFADGVDDATATAVLAEAGASLVRLVSTPALLAQVDMSATVADALASDVRVAMVEPNLLVESPEPVAATDAPIDVSADASTEAGTDAGAMAEGSFEHAQPNAPWGLDRTDQRDLPLTGGFDSAGTGAGVTVYVVDSGVRGDHAEFGGRVLPGFSVFGGNGWNDCVGHGTHVAGTVAGRSYGIAKEATIVPVQVGNCASLFTFDIIWGLDWVIDHHQAGVPAVVNMSLGSNANPTLDAVVRDVIADGIPVVVAAGNYGEPACWLSPAREPQAITVAAVDRTDWSPNWSNYGSCVDIFAPGDDIRSAVPDSQNASASASGTSMAAPHVTGAVALILQREPTLTPAQVSDRLYAQATIGRVGNGGAGSPNRLLFVPSGNFVPLSPGRLMDTRPGMTTVDGEAAGIGQRQGGVITELRVAGRAGVPADAAAAVLNVTMTGAMANGFLTVFPCGSPQPLSSNLNVWAGGTIPNAVVAKIGVGGSVCLFSNVATDLVVDVNGYHPAGSSYRALWPARLLDTRPDGVTVDGGAARVGQRLAGYTTELVVAGRGGVPWDASAVVLNVTVTNPVAGGYVTVYPCGTPQPLTSNLNFWTGATIPNAVVAKVGFSGTVCMYTSVGLELIVDVNGYYPAGSSYQAMSPGRLLDSRYDGATIDGIGARTGPLVAGTITRLPVAGRPGVPFDAAAVVLNVTVTNPIAAGYVTVFPCGSPQPLSSNLNFWQAGTIPNAVVAKVGDLGEVCLFTSVTTDLVVDVNGYHTA